MASDTLRLAASLTHLDEATRFVRSAATAAQFPAPALPFLDLLVEEAFVNIARYAYPPAETGGPVFLTASPLSPGRIRLEFADQGIPFNPLERPAPNFDVDLAEMPPGGLGIHLLRKWTEALDYRRTNGWNHLSLTCSLESVHVSA